MQAYAEEEGEEQLVLLKQRAADVLVDAEGEVVAQVLDPRGQVGRRLTVDDGLRTPNKDRYRIDASAWCFTPSQPRRVISGREKTKCVATTSNNSDSLYMTHSTVENLRSLGKMKLDESGRQKLGSQKPCQQVQHACIAIF